MPMAPPYIYVKRVSTKIRILDRASAGKETGGLARNLACRQEKFGPKHLREALACLLARCWCLLVWFMGRGAQYLYFVGFQFHDP